MMNSLIQSVPGLVHVHIKVSMYHITVGELYQPIKLHTHCAQNKRDRGIPRKGTMNKTYLKIAYIPSTSSVTARLMLRTARICFEPPTTRYPIGLMPKRNGFIS
ncbi:uncharacterized protein LOC125225877 isoform X4 [Leguminivora glycinivorella]|uniref:uncharacterized protein LOC125225877 isoform X4 n=1 Tax=Leguminivora glycinivorella TaxID=1035111 RepID=UPI00200C9A8F|nr:uncharacterized protein LOC125225877 isoform X4 [Leguminivora glycinivorella]